jgi:hypothetical protein
LPFDLDLAFAADVIEKARRKTPAGLAVGIVKRGHANGGFAFVLRNQGGEAMRHGRDRRPDQKPPPSQQ